MVLGPNESGKSVLAKHLARSFATALVVDPLKGYEDLPKSHTIYRPSAIAGDAAAAEVDKVIRRLVLAGPTLRKVDLFLVDEANRFFPARKTLHPMGALLNDMFRHSGLSWGAVARRPVSLYTDLMELAQWQYFFRLTGRNDLQLVDDLHKGLADVVADLPPFHFVERHASTGDYQVLEPVPFTP